MEENVDMNPAQLDPTAAFREKLELQRVASDAVNKANIDSRLRRALLRKYTGQQQETDVTTGEMGQQLEVSFDGKDQRLWSCVK